MHETFCRAAERTDSADQLTVHCAPTSSSLILPYTFEPAPFLAYFNTQAPSLGVATHSLALERPPRPSERSHSEARRGRWPRRHPIGRMNKLASEIKDLIAFFLDKSEAANLARVSEGWNRAAERSLCRDLRTVYPGHWERPEKVSNANDPDRGHSEHSTDAGICRSIASSGFHQEWS